MKKKYKTGGFPHMQEKKLMKLMELELYVALSGLFDRNVLFSVKGYTDDDIKYMMYKALENMIYNITINWEKLK